MTSEIWRDFDPNLNIPIGLKNVNIRLTPQDGIVLDTPENDATTADMLGLEDDETGEGEDAADDILDPPGSMEIISQTVRTAPDGRQVIDVVIEVEDIAAATDYEIRVTKAGI